MLAQLPRVLEQAESAAQAFASMAKDGLRLDDDTIRRMAVEEAAHNRSGRWAMWLAAVALAGIAVLMMG